MARISAGALDTLLTERAHPGEIAIDPWRAIIFPNAIREQRRRKGMDSLLGLAEQLPAIPYIRLSKIERGEVTAKASELRAIGHAIGVLPAALLIDVAADDFSVALWAGLRGEAMPVQREGEELAMLLAAAFRARRADDPALTLAALGSEHSLPAVIVSRIENAAKVPDRWNRATLSAICGVLGVASPRDLSAHLRALHAAGDLDPWLERIPGAAAREERTRMLIERLRAELALADSTPPPLHRKLDRATAQSGMIGLVRLAVRGVPMDDGRISPAPSGGDVIVPPGSGANAYALRMGRPSLGSVIPGHAVLVVDPDRFPVGGGLAILREEIGGDVALRVVSITIDRDGRMTGHSIMPEKQIAIDSFPPGDVAMVTAILFT